MKRACNLALALVLAIATIASAQTDANERAFPQSKAAIEKALKAMQANMAGRLPSLEGFAATSEHPLDRYQRGYYQATEQVTAIPAGGSVVRITSKITAWYSDPLAIHSGYQVLPSNGRLEADLLDQLAEQLGKSPAISVAEPPTSPAHATPTNPAPADGASSTQLNPPVPERKFPASPSFSSSRTENLAGAGSESSLTETSSKTDSALQAEAESLGEVLKNQAHPKNLVAVKKSGTPVVATPSLNAKPLFLASLHDEFEMLEFNQDWVHVRISGLSRGWIWRNSLEMPEGIPDTASRSAAAAPSAADLYRAAREETAPFPGDWPPLRGKNVKIFTIQKTDDNAKDPGPDEKLEYAKYLLDKSYSEMAGKTTEVAGVVLIYDAVDGGMIAAALPTLQQWKAGKLSDAALWHNCFFDPPETFSAAAPSPSNGADNR